uniref:SURF1-like protein n=1 Tax=Acrobeloides nanus TaxID=290746 RepID=A0A914DRF5_9BILA
MRPLIFLTQSRQKFLISYVPSFCSLCRCHVKKNDDHRIIGLGSRAQKYQDEFGTKRPRKKFEPSSLIFLVIPATTFALGCWQVYRLQWKTDLLERIRRRMKASSIDFPINDLENINDYEYSKVRINGRYLYEKQITIGPRRRFDKNAPTSQNDHATETDFGYQVITPFQIDGSDKVIMVNRGWFPDKNAPSGPSGTIPIDGIVRKSETKGLFGYENIPEQGVWYYKNAEQMARILGTLPIIVDASLETTIRGGPIGGQTLIALRNDHVSYFLTWYGLSIATSYIWWKRFIR